MPADSPTKAGMLTHGRIFPVAIKTLDVPSFPSLSKPAFACLAASKALVPLTATLVAKFANGMESGSEGPPGANVAEAAEIHH